MPKKTQRTPQDKKRLSYAKDRRNCYGNSDKAARKAIPLRKAQENRKVRRKASMALDVRTIEGDDTAQSDLKNNTARVGGWTKGADKPLGEHVADKLDGRVSRIGGKARRREKYGWAPK